MVIKLIEDGTINTTPWITHRTSFDDVIGEFETFTKPESGVIKSRDRSFLMTTNHEKLKTHIVLMMLCYEEARIVLEAVTFV